MKTKTAMVAGAGGFIGHHLVKYLRANGYWVRGVDLKVPEFEPTEADEFETLDLRQVENCRRAVRGVEEVFQLAADMGGIGYISAFRAWSEAHGVPRASEMLKAISNCILAFSTSPRFFHISPNS